MLRRPSSKHQRGAILAISLVLLIILTLVGVTAMRMTITEEKMAGNMRDRSLAFQAAEAAIRDAEAFINGTASVAVFNGNGGLLGEANAEPDYFNTNTWTGTNSRVFTDGATTIPGVSAQPRFVIKYMGERNTGFVDLSSPPPPTASLFKISARGVGLSNTSQVLVQTYFGRIF